VIDITVLKTVLRKCIKNRGCDALFTYFKYETVFFMTKVGKSSGPQTMISLVCEIVCLWRTVARFGVLSFYYV
jgi:hypothetical protein